jgi:putative hydrolase of the HAD superfamily
VNVDAVFFDFGGVIISSPFEAFAAYEERIGLPRDAIRRINTHNPDRNAWARFERNELDISEFIVTFENEARSLGYELSGEEVLACLNGTLRPEMVRALGLLRGRVHLALLTNNVAVADTATMGGDGGAVAEVLRQFDVIVESSAVGCRKPEPRFYEMACELSGVRPENVVFLDDLGINLKPARAMGMTTIKVADPIAALTELSRLVSVELVEYPRG